VKINQPTKYFLLFIFQLFFGLILDCTPPPPHLPTNGVDSDEESELIFSQFDPANFQTLFLPGTGNKPLDPLAVRAIHRTLVEMSSESLAAHLAKTDLEFFGLNDRCDDGYLSPCDFPGNGMSSSFNSGNSRLVNLANYSETGRQFRQDTLDRCLCLRTLVKENLFSIDQNNALCHRMILRYKLQLFISGDCHDFDGSKFVRVRQDVVQVDPGGRSGD
jgi:hypothetical protein